MQANEDAQPFSREVKEKRKYARNDILRPMCYREIMPKVHILGYPATASTCQNVQNSQLRFF